MMLKQLIGLVSLTLSTQLSFAETCPSVADINKNALHGWQVYDTEESKPLSKNRLLDFNKHAEQFALAEWTDATHKTGSIHCYYRDKNGSDLEAYIIKNDFIPKDSQHYWYQVTGYRQCAAGLEKCEFQSVTHQQLAKK